MNFSFDSVSSFLRQAQEAKSEERMVIDNSLSPLLADPSTFAIAPDAAEMLEASYERYGDEALKAMAIVALGKWVELHGKLLEEHMINGSSQEAVMTACDMTKLVEALRLLQDVGSFGGDEDYRKAIKKQINQAVLEQLEENGLDAETAFNDPLM